MSDDSPPIKKPKKVSPEVGITFNTSKFLDEVAAERKKVIEI